MRPFIGKEELRRIKLVLESKFLSEGETTRKFEKAISNYVNAKYGIATTSATTALHTSFECIGVKGKKVLVSDFTFPATALAILLAGGKPVLIDVEKETMNTSKNIIEDSLNEEISCICPVSLFGNPLDASIYRIRKNGVKIVEDAATNLGSKIDGRFVGTQADITCFSFHPRKIITTGEGGMITTNHSMYEKKMRAFKMFGKIKNNFLNMGTNYKLSDILSAIGLEQISKVENIIQSRINKAKIYNELLEKIDYIKPQLQTRNSRHTYQSYTCRIYKPNMRDKIMKELAKKNTETQIGTYALHCLPFFKNFQRRGKLENSEFLYHNSITLPLHEELKEEEQKNICRVIRNCLSKS